MSDEFIGILDGPLLPRSVGVGKEDRNTEDTSNSLVISKFKSVVGSNSLEFILIGEQEQNSCFSSCRRIKSAINFLDETHVGRFLDKGKNGRLLSFGNNGIHLNVPKSLPIDLRRSLMDRDSVRDMSGRGFLVKTSTPMFELMTTVKVKEAASSLILPNPLVDCFVRDANPFLPKSTGYLLWRPLVLG